MPSPAEIRVPQAGRYALPGPARGRLGRQQRAWGVGQALALTGALLLPVGQQWADLSWALALGVGVAGALLPDAGKAAGAAAAVLAGVLLAGLAADGSATASILVAPELAAGFTTRGLSGVQVLAGGALAGGSLAWLDGGPRQAPRVVQVALAGAATAGLGWWAAQALVPTSWSAVPQALGQAGTAALVMSQVPLFSTLRYRSSDRIPAPHRLKARLQAAYRAPCLQAWRLDRELAREAPDPDTRDGLGEVAAWVYRLQVTLQRLDAEIEAIDARPLATRIADLEHEARAEADPFTAERKAATVGHLRQLQRHRDALAEERGRTAALVDYAGAFLEEARAGLALARLQPDAHAPGALQDVLTRLRTHGAEREARRRSARELAAV